MEFVNVATLIMISLLLGHAFSSLERKNPTVKTFIAFMVFALIWSASQTIIPFVNNVYWLFVTLNIIQGIILFNISLLILLLGYRLRGKRIDWLYILIAAINIVVVFFAFYWSTNYEIMSFWRDIKNIYLKIAVTILLSIPMIYALILIYKQNRSVNGRKGLKASCFWFGLILAFIITVISEMVIPVLVDEDGSVSLVSLAFFVAGFFTYLSFFKNDLFTLEHSVIYDEFFLNSSNGIIVTLNNKNIIAINNKALSLLSLEKIEKNETIEKALSRNTDYIYHMTESEISYSKNGRITYISIAKSTSDEDCNSKAIIYFLYDATLSEEKAQTNINELEHKAYYDSLTGLHNRRYLTEKIEQNDLYKGINVGVIFFDIDNFKKVNDTYGHQVGDNLLVAIANSLQSKLSVEDTAIRFGGDEFIVFSFKCDETKLTKLANKIDYAIKSNSYIKADRSETITSSIGLALGPFEKFEDLISAADNAMYRSKHDGKNGNPAKKSYFINTL